MIGTNYFGHGREKSIFASENITKHLNLNKNTYKYLLTGGDDQFINEHDFIQTKFEKSVWVIEESYFKVLIIFFIIHLL